MSVQSTLGFRSRSGIPVQWREVWWSASTDPNDVINGWQSVRAGNQSLLQIRQQFLTQSAEIYYLKCTYYSPGQPKNTRVIRMFPPLKGYAAVADYCGVSVSFSLQIPGHRRSVSIRGIPDTWTTDNALTTTGSKGVQNIISGLAQGNGAKVSKTLGYFAALQAYLNCGIYELNAAATYGGNGIENDGDGLVTITTDPALIAQLPVGSLVVVTACKSMPLLQSTWKVASVDATNKTITLGGSTQFRAIAGSTCTLKVGTKVTDVTDWQVNPIGVRTRDTGRPTDGPRGRRSARIRHR